MTSKNNQCNKDFKKTQHTRDLSHNIKITALRTIMRLDS
jgi:hypothetical protein